MNKNYLLKCWSNRTARQEVRPSRWVSVSVREAIYQCLFLWFLSRDATWRLHFTQVYLYSLIKESTNTTPYDYRFFLPTSSSLFINTTLIYKAITFFLYLTLSCISISYRNYNMLAQLTKCCTVDVKSNKLMNCLVFSTMVLLVFSSIVIITIISVTPIVMLAVG